jgi:hypothetical protein
MDIQGVFFSSKRNKNNRHMQRDFLINVLRGC